jgi:hypothetical protein
MFAPASLQQCICTQSIKVHEGHRGTVIRKERVGGNSYVGNGVHSSIPVCLFPKAKIAVPYAVNAIPGVTVKGTDEARCVFVTHSVLQLLLPAKVVRSQVFTAVTVKNTVSWAAAPCSSCMNRRFGGKHSLHHGGEKNW